MAPSHRGLRGYLALRARIELQAQSIWHAHNRILWPVLARMLFQIEHLVERRNLNRMPAQRLLPRRISNTLSDQDFPYLKPSAVTNDVLLVEFLFAHYEVNDGLNESDN